MSTIPAVKEILERYIWNRTKQKFVDQLLGRTVPDFVVKTKLVKFEGEKADSIMESMKAAGISDPPLQRENRISVLEEAYAQLRPHIQLRKRKDDRSVVLYQLNPNGEVRFTGTLKPETFFQALGSDVALNAAARAVYAGDLNPELTRLGLDFVAFAHHMNSRFQLDADLLLTAEPAQISWDPAIPAYKQFDPRIVCPGPIAGWEEFLGRLDFPETYKAWIWSIFEPANKMRQCLWIYGEGFDGKSITTSVIADFYEGAQATHGSTHVATFDTANFEGDSFSMSNVVNKRLCVFGEVKYPGVITHPKIKSLTGGDRMEINEKNERKYTAPVYSKLLFMSQHFPSIDLTDYSHVSRLLLLQVAPNKAELREKGDNTWKARLTAEMPAFLYSCREAYKTQCPDGEQLIVPPDMVTKIKTHCGHLDTEIVKQFISEHLEFDESFTVKRLSLINRLNEFFMRNEQHNRASNGLRATMLTKILAHEYQCEAKTFGAGQTGFSGVRLKQMGGLK